MRKYALWIEMMRMIKYQYKIDYLMYIITKMQISKRLLKERVLIVLKVLLVTHNK